MGFRIPVMDYSTILGGIGDSLVNAYDKYQAPKLLEQAMLMQNGGASPAPAAILGGQPVPTSSPSTPQGQPSGGFSQAVQRTLGFEGGLNPRDTNGTPSNMGINAAANPDVNVASLTKDQATDIYKKRYWDAINGDQLSKVNPALAYAGFDTAVIAGPGKAMELIQQSGGDPNRLLALRKQFQDSLIATNPEKYGKYEKAWNNRIAGLQQDVASMGAGAAPTLPPGGYMAKDSRGNPVPVDADGNAIQSGAVPPRNQVADASGTITPQSAPPDVQPQQRGPQYSPQVIQRLMANPYTRAYGQLLMQNMMKQETPAFHQFGNTVYRQQGGQLVPVVNVPEKPMTMSEGQTLVDPRTGQVISNIPKGPMTMSEGQTLVDPKTGQVISTIPKDRPPVTLSEGQVLVDPKTGNMIATGGMKNDVAKNNSQREAEADRLGLQGDDRTQYIFNGKVPSQAEKQTDGQANAALYASRMREAENILSKPEIQAASMDRMQIAKSKAPLGIGNSLVTKEYQMADQAKRDFINATLRRESGAAISPSEFDNAEKQYFPQPGDKPEVLSQKAANRKTAMEGIANAASPNFKEQFFGTKKPTLGENKAQREPLPKGYSAARAVSEAKQAIEQGRDPEGVKAKLKSFGIDPSIVDK